MSPLGPCGVHLRLGGARSPQILRHERDLLTAEPILHHAGRLEVAPAREHSVPVHHAVAGQAAAHRLVEGPPDDAGRLAAPQVLGDVAVRGHAARRDLCHHLSDTPKKAFERSRLFSQDGLIYFVSSNFGDIEQCSLDWRGGPQIPLHL